MPVVRSLGRQFVRSLAIVLALAIGLLGPARVDAQIPSWNLHSTESLPPTGRTGHAMAFDNNRGVTVLFGGLAREGNGTATSGETWERNGTEWTRRIEVGPSARSGHSMAYDSLRHVTVLYGGGGAADTWEWNGTTWSQRAVGGLSPGVGSFAMAFDSARGVTVLFGGNDNSSATSGETWEWNGATWTRRLVAGPLARSGHAMAYDSVRGVTVLFGGFNFGPGFLADTWEWNGMTWTQRVADGPAARRFHVMAFDAARGVTVLFGGSVFAGGNSTYEWNGTNWSQVESSGSQHSESCAMAYDIARQTCVLFGGIGTNVSSMTDETWTFNGAQWTEHPRTYSGPSPRTGHSMVYHAASQKTLLFGGDTTGETWLWDGVSWTRRMVQGPSPRSGFSLVYDSARAVAVLFGGQDASGQRGDTWEWDGAAWTQLLVNGPSARSGHVMAFDALRGVVVQFWGGSSSSETWEWNGAAWSRRIPNGGPDRRYNCAMAYDSSRGVTLLYGGTNYEGYFMGGTLQWDGTSWTSAAINEPGRNWAYCAMAFDASRAMTVLYGGTGSDLSEGFPRSVQNTDTWVLCVAPTITVEPAGQTACLAGAASFSVVASGVGALTYQWQIESAPLGSNLYTDIVAGPLMRSGQVVGTSSGTHSPLLTVQHDPSSIDFLRFRCVVASACSSVTTEPAQLSLGTPADIGSVGGAPGRDGVYDNNDFIVFISYFFLQMPQADRGTTGGVPGADGRFDNNDFIVFIDQFFAGC